MKKIYLGLFFIVTATSCASYDQQASPAPEEEVKTETPEPVSGVNSAANELYQSAVESHEQGQIERGLAILERAYRIDPRNPSVTLLMAEFLLESEKLQRAEQWALKSIDLTQDKTKKAEAWRIIATCRSELGDAKGAQEALEKAVQLDDL